MINKIAQFCIALMLQMVVMIRASIAAAQHAAAKILAGEITFKDFLADPTADADPKLIVGIVISLTVGLIVIGYVFPVGMSAYHAINFTACGMTTDEIAMYGVLGILAILSLMLAFIGVAMWAFNK